MISIKIGSRQSGKTTECIRRCADLGGYIVCHNHNEAIRISEQAKKMGLNIPFPITYSEFVNGEFYSSGVKSLHIDNADLLFEMWLHDKSKGCEIKSCYASWSEK